jgi:1-acyl-sn-glycerol-3-phosphate acyltransferase
MYVFYIYIYFILLIYILYVLYVYFIYIYFILIYYILYVLYIYVILDLSLRFHIRLEWRNLEQIKFKESLLLICPKSLPSHLLCKT